MSALSANATLPPARYRTHLEQRAEFLCEEIRQTLLRSNRESYLAITDPVHRAGDHAFADLMIDLDFAEIDRNLIELKEVESALRRLARNSFGTCETCGEAVDDKRLQANPAVRRCTGCHHEYERMRAHRARHV